MFNINITMLKDLILMVSMLVFSVSKCHLNFNGFLSMTGNDS